MSRYALGLIETSGLVGAIEATDAASKAAAVVVSSAELTPGTLMTVKIEGELGAVQAAVESAAEAADRVGHLVAAHVIPNPDDGLDPMLPGRRYVSKYHPDDDRPRLTPAGDAAPAAPAKPKKKVGDPPETTESGTYAIKDLEKMTVAELRKIARSLTRIPLKGREISKANKTELLGAIRSVLDMD